MMQQGQEQLTQLAELRENKAFNVEALSRAKEMQMSDSNALDIALLLTEVNPSLLRLFYLFTQYKAKFMTDAKTTITSIVQACVLVGGLVGYQISPASSQVIITVVVSLYSVLGVVKGLFTKDAPTVEPTK